MVSAMRQLDYLLPTSNSIAHTAWIRSLAARNMRGLGALVAVIAMLFCLAPGAASATGR